MMRISFTNYLRFFHVSSISLLLTSLFAQPLLAQKNRALSSREPISMTPMDEPETFTHSEVYIVRPSLPIRPNGAENSAKHTIIEPADSIFVIGNSTTSETRKIAKVDHNGWAIVLEDVTKPVLYLRLQRLRTEYVEVRLYAENGALMFDKTVPNLPLGTQVEMGYRGWPSGLYSLHVQLDDGLRWIKKIQLGSAVSVH